MHGTPIKYYLLLSALLCHSCHPVLMQRTSLDDTFRNLYRPLRLIGLNFAGRSGDNPGNRQLVRDMGVSEY